MNKAVGQLIVDLGAIQANWLRIVSEVGSPDQVSAVVKADAYGLGVAEVAPALYSAGCRHFFVATVDEALELKGVLSQDDATIYILSGVTEDAFPICASQHFTPVLYTLDLVRQWAAYCELHRPLASVIKVDTGMHRLGVTLDQFDQLLAEPRLVRAANPIYLMSHLACADDEAHPLNAIQLDCFQVCYERLAQIVPAIRTSFANSSGVFLGARYHSDLARPGYSLYGGNPAPGKTNPMRGVVSLSLPVAQVKQVRGPASVGYGATFDISEGERCRLAIVRGGYADGIFRCLSNVGCGFVNGQRVDIVGRVSMDTVVFDVTAIAGDQDISAVELLGPNQSVDDLAGLAKTIGYEVLTQLGERYARTYIGKEDR